MKPLCENSVLELVHLGQEHPNKYGAVSGCFGYGDHVYLLGKFGREYSFVLLCRCVSVCVYVCVLSNTPVSGLLFGDSVSERFRT